MHSNTNQALATARVSAAKIRIRNAATVGGKIIQLENVEVTKSVLHVEAQNI